MKISQLLIGLLISLFAFTNTSYSQKCREYHKSKNCKIEKNNDFKLSSLSRSHYLEVGKTVTYEVVLYGQKEIIIQCCTENEYYPLRFKLKSAITGDLIYDNKYDNYINFISLSLDRTELISIEISFELTDENINVLKSTKACTGMAIYIEKTPVRN